MWKLYLKSFVLVTSLSMLGTALVVLFELPQETYRFLAVLTGVIVYASYMAPERDRLIALRAEKENENGK